MYYTDQNGVNDYVILETHLLNTGKLSVLYLIPLLRKNENLFYEGSKDATIGNSLQYRVKDAAAYYIGKITGIQVRFFEDHADRDVEILRLKEKLK